MLSGLFDIERLIHSIKTAIACIIGFLLTRLVGFPADQWIVVTIIVIMCAQLYVGGVVQKAYFRFLGTLAGCLIATLTLILVGDSNLAIALTISISAFLFSYVATSREDLSYACTLGAVTTVIIMLGQKPTLAFAASRFLEISVGILIATLVSQLVLPIHARTHLRRNQAATLSEMRDYYTACMVTREIDKAPFYYEELDENIVKSLSKQRQLAKDAIREPWGSSFDPNVFIQSLYCEKEILRAINFMHTALQHIKSVDKLLAPSSTLHAFNDHIIQALNTLIRAAEQKPVPTEHIHIPAIYKLKEDIRKNFIFPPQEDQLYLEGFLFSADTLAHYLIRLASLYHIAIHRAPTES